MASGQTTILAGYSGFVGGNLAIGAERCGHPFDMLCNSVNITEAFGTRPDMLVYAGVRAEKFTADSRPEEDWEHIKGAAENIGRIAPLRLVLISTIDVYDKPADADENTPINAEKLRPYGGNRLRLERMAREVCPDTLVVRLPALIGDNLKKNFIFDLINVIPTYLKTDIYARLSADSAVIRDAYAPHPNGMYKLKAARSAVQDGALRQNFRERNFSAVNFTDSRARFSFYDLSLLYGHIAAALRADLPCLNTATEALTTAQIYRRLCGADFCNHLPGQIPDYSYKTLYAHFFGGCGDYILTREQVLARLEAFYKRCVTR